MYFPHFLGSMNASISDAIENGIPQIPKILPVGFRFNPRDEELIGYYLKLFLSCHYNNDLPSRRIINGLPFAFLDLYKEEPEDLPGLCKFQSDDPVWYFFSPRTVYKDQKKNSYKRKTKTGYWTITGNHKKVENLGQRSTLSFYKDSPKKTKTPYIIHEYEIIESSELPNRDNIVLVKLMINEKPKELKTPWNEQIDGVSSSDSQGRNPNEIPVSGDGYHQDVTDHPAQNHNTSPQNAMFSGENMAQNHITSFFYSENQNHTISFNDFGNQNQNELMDVDGHQVFPQRDYSSHVMTAMPTYGTVEVSQELFVCENIPLVSEFQGEWNPTPFVWDFQEDDWNPTQLLPLCFDNEDDGDLNGFLFSSSQQGEQSASESIPCTQNQVSFEQDNASSSMTYNSGSHIPVEVRNTPVPEESDDDWRDYLCLTDFYEHNGAESADFTCPDMEIDEWEWDAFDKPVSSLNSTVQLALFAEETSNTSTPT